MNSPKLLFKLLCLQLLLPLVLRAQSTTTDIPAGVDSLIQVSRGHTAVGEFEAAFAASESAGSAALRCCTERSAAYAAYSFNQGRVYDFMGDYAAAIPLYLKARELRAELLGKLHVDYGKSLNNLAIIYNDLGRYAEAETLYLESLAVREHNFGKESGAYAKVLDNLCATYIDQGDFEKAELLGLQGKAIREKVYGREHEQYAVSLSNLASIYYRTNNPHRALELYLEAKSIYDRQERLAFYDYVNILNNLGSTYNQLDDNEKAETHFQEAADLRAEILGKDHPRYAWSLQHLANVHYAQGNLERAEAEFSEALRILQNADEEESTYYAFTLQDLADLYVKKMNWEPALEAHTRALSILAEIVPRNHPRYLLGVRAVAQVEQALGRPERAGEHLRLLARLSDQRLATAVRHMSEEELGNYLKQLTLNLNQYFSLAEEYADITDVGYDKILTYKGFLLAQTVQAKQLMELDSSLLPIYREMDRLHAELSKAYATVGVADTVIERLERAQYQQEKQLVRKNALLSEALTTVSWHEVRDVLSADAAAIEFVRYTDVMPPGEQDMSYAALILLPGAERPHFVPLCRERELDSLMVNRGVPPPEFINKFYHPAQTGAKLYELLWAPIEAWLSEQAAITTIYHSPVGLLHRINLGALPLPDQSALSKHYDLRKVSSTRTLVYRPQGRSDTVLPRALLYGGIDYGNATNDEGVSLDNKLPEQRGSYGIQRGYNPEQGYWQQLAWTEVEILTAKDLLAENGYQPVLQMGAEADEASLKTLTGTANSPHLLHLATHGYFFPDPEGKAEADQLTFSNSERAMIRSGLVLADGNFAWANGYARETAAEDGILTAFEVSRMNLRDTELVILSACETGLGDIRGTEGVYGLQRAFKMAGARYLIMTLWQVPDFQSQAFMTTFYLAWLEEGKSIPEAFRAAQAYMRARYKDAFEWAGFVLVE